MILLHYTGMDNEEETIKRLCCRKAQVSAHYLILENGAIIGLVSEDKRAWHAGQSQWHQEKDINSCSIGIEISNRGHNYLARDKTPPAFTNIQISAVIALIKDLRTRWTIPQNRILGHSDVAPFRKCDPGEMFPWSLLAQEGIGLWPPLEPFSDDTVLFEKNLSSSDIKKVHHNLSIIGYAIEQKSFFDNELKTYIKAFQRHFRPTQIDGITDYSTINTLEHVSNLFQKYTSL